MGRRGPPPTPTAILAARGSRRATQGREHEPVVHPGRPECPDWLDEEAKSAWAQLVPVLESMGVLTRADAHALARYCQLLIRWKRAELFIQKYGETYPVKSARGMVKMFFAWPQVGIAHKLSLALTKLEQEFGLTPSARSRVKVDPAFTRTPSQSAFRAMFMTSPSAQPTSLIEDEESRRVLEMAERNTRAQRERSNASGAEEEDEAP